MKFKIIHHVDQKTIQFLYNEYVPVFIVSTGRAGTKFIIELLKNSDNVAAFHEPHPILQYFSNYAFHNQQSVDVLMKIIDGARMELILETLIQDKIYVESNQCLTFFAPAIAELFKKSKFVHLIRFPGDFVRSALRKGWHKNDSIWEAGRVKMADTDTWAAMDQIEKLSWTWVAHNNFLCKLKEALGPARVFTLKLEDLVDKDEVISELFNFIGARKVPSEKTKEIQDSKINKFVIQGFEPENIKKVGDFPGYQDWNEEMKGNLKQYCLELAELFGYEL